ncbi:MAG: TIGR04255 family protein [Chloroflexi bacterium]|nr:TIGR04255 family protein [Chloroflexota bacterium]
MPDEFHFQEDLPLTKPPLKEAWLEVRWNLDSDPAPQFPFALGIFRQSIKEEFDTATPLEQARVPIEMLPHVVRYRFTKGESKFPLIHLGPGVASVNYTSSYTWEIFKEKAEYLREKLNFAYEDNLSIERLVLRYRNTIEFDFINEDLLEFMQSKLNISITPPLHIPGSAAFSTWPRGLSTTLEYELKKPAGKGTIKLDTIIDKEKDKPGIQFQLEIFSLGEENWATSGNFITWLEDAHSIIHEWFFALIEGSLFKKFE